MGFFLPSALVQALEVTPTYQIFTLKPGEKAKSELTLTSNEPTDLNVVPGAKDWKGNTENKEIKTADWLKVDEKPFILKSGANRVIKFTVTAPPKAKGEVMGMLSFATKSTDVTMLSFRLSVAMYVVIEGTEKKEGEVAAISVVPSSNTAVSFLFNNKGNVHLRPKGLIEIYDNKDTLVLNAVYDSSVPSYPKQPRAYQATIKNYRLPAGNYTAVVKLEDADWHFQYPVQKKKFSVSAEGMSRDK